MHVCIHGCMCVFMRVCVCLCVCVSECVVENQAHCDFVKLRTMLIRTHMNDLKEVTCDVHYENYRAQCIQTMTRCVFVCVWVCAPAQG